MTAALDGTTTTRDGFPYLTETLPTARLKLRPLRAEDAPRIAMFAGDWDVARMTARLPHSYSERDARDFIAGAAIRKALAIVHANGVIGVIGLDDVGTGHAELGYWLGKPFWGRGFVTEAGRAVIASSLQSCPTLTVTASHFQDNPASGHVLAKLGFTLSGERMIRSTARGTDVRALTYRLSRSATLPSPSPSRPSP